MNKGSIQKIKKWLTEEWKNSYRRLQVQQKVLCQNSAWAGSQKTSRNLPNREVEHSGQQERMC